VEGSSIASTCRLVGAAKLTVLRLLADAGTFCADYHDQTVRNLYPERVQMDEVWAFVGAKERSVKAGSVGYGSAWTWVAMDADSKLVISYLTGQRESKTAKAFVWDTCDRVDSYIQLTTDGYREYREAVEEAFGKSIDFAQIHKEYGRDVYDDRRYSPPVCVGTTIVKRSGMPDQDHISTSFVERQNLSLRMGSRRFTRLTNAFSKKLENHIHAISLHYWYFNFARKHMTIKTTPAIANGIADRVLTVRDLVDMMEAEEMRRGGRLSDYHAQRVE